MNDEHVIPKSLGGFRSTVIRASIRLNSHFATRIDGPVADDPLIIFGRRDARARGHSRKDPLPRLRGARAWKRGEALPGGEARYTVEIPGSGQAKVWDRRAGAYLRGDVFKDTAFFIEDWKIDHLARLRFAVKTLVGVGWKLFHTDLLDSLDMDFLRAILSPDTDPEASVSGRLTFSDPVLATQDPEEQRALKDLEQALVREKITTILMREFDGDLEWSVACVGHLVGTIRVPVKVPLLRGDVKPRGGIRLEIMREGLRPVLVEPFG